MWIAESAGGTLPVFRPKVFAPSGQVGSAGRWKPQLELPLLWSTPVLADQCKTELIAFIIADVAERCQMIREIAVDRGWSRCPSS